MKGRETEREGGRKRERERWKVEREKESLFSPPSPPMRIAAMVHADCVCVRI